MRVKGIQASIELDGDMLVITKGGLGQPKTERRIHLRDVAGVTFKPGSRLFHGYIQVLVAGSEAAPERKGLLYGGRPHRDDMNSLSIRQSVNGEARKLVASIEAGRERLSR